MEGGASRTIFSCGVTDCFLEHDIMPDHFIGVSAGIAFGTSYLSKQKGRNRILAEQYMPNSKYMGAKYLFDKDIKCYYNLPYVFDEVPNELLPFDYEAFRAFPGVVEAVVTNVKTGKAEYLEIDREDHAFKEVIASCALPILFQPVKIRGNYYLDGGLSDSIPYEHLVERGCDKNIVILTRTRDYVKKVDKITRLAANAYKKFPKTSEAILSRAENYNACLKRLYEDEQAGKVFVIAPESTLGVGRTEASKEKLNALYEEGYRIANERLDALEKYLMG